MTEPISLPQITSANNIPFQIYLLRLAFLNRCFLLIDACNYPHTNMLICSVYHYTLYLVLYYFNTIHPLLCCHHNTKIKSTHSGLWSISFWKRGQICLVKLLHKKSSTIVKWKLYYEHTFFYPLFYHCHIWILLPKEEHSLLIASLG